MNNSSTLVEENRQDAEKQSAEKFQKFMFDLFEKNGVINDLRAYLRGHIVDVLKSTQSGETLSCQKHFTQRLELTFQAINILIAEYLLRLEFSYTLSVFVSEIPLANMVFSFARMLMETHDHSELRFKNTDVYSILNYIGLKCDSDHANSVVEMYNDNKKTPLLLCIFKCLPMYKLTTEPTVDKDQESSADESSTSKSSIEKYHHKSRHEKCRHYSHCKSCRARIARLKDKYKRKERGFEQNLRQSSVNSLNVESFLKNISVMEKGLIDELFQQLKSVYEAEMEMMKEEENKRVKRSFVAHAQQLQKKKEQLESSFKARETALAEALHEKKRVLWSVARMLKQQHEQMARAMADVRAESRDLALKEETLNTQLAEAEANIRKRGEDMRKQITKELTILSKHLETMKLERDNINRERAQLQDIKPNSDHENRSKYNILEEELLILKKYVQTVQLETKCGVERGTMTELSWSKGLLDNDVVLNNRKEASEDEVPKRLVNDLKKQKNVNFEQMTNGEQSQPHRLVYDYQQHNRSRSRSSSEAGDAPESEELILLKEENRRLKEFARQQKDHIDSLAWQQARLQSRISSQTSNLAPPLQPTVMSHTSNFTPQTSNDDLQSCNFAPQSANAPPQPVSYATLSANFPSRSTDLNAQSSTLASQVANVTPSSQPNPQTFNFAARSAFFTPQSSNILSPQTGAFNPQGTFGNTELHPANVIQRPRTASPTGRRPIGHRLQPSTSVANLNVGWRVGAGEELSVFTSVPTRVVLPGDDVPFIGVVGNRHTDNRRYLINQWRSLRRRLSPVSGVTKRPTSSSRDKPVRTSIKTGGAAPCAGAGPTILSPQIGHASTNVQPSCSKNNKGHLERNYLQPKSTAEKSVKAEHISKEILQNEGIETPTPILEKSPSSILREAKLRLRKLEIEAEAVEKSYLDFRRKREAMKEERENDAKAEKITSTSKKLNETYTKDKPRVPLSMLDIDKLLNEINTKLDLPSFKNNNLTEFKINPIPKVYSEAHDVKNETQAPKDYTEESKKENYIETPINEFRRFYHSERRLERMKRHKSPASKSDSNRNSKRETIKEFKNDKEKELEIFKHNLGKIYNMSENSIVNYPSDLSVCEPVEIHNDVHENTSDIVENENKLENLNDIAENDNIIDNVSDINENEYETNENTIQEEENISESKEIQNFFENTDKPNDTEQKEDTTDNKDDVPDKNLLRVDVESVSEMNSVQVNESRTQGFVLFVASSVDNAISECDTTGAKISTQMTIVVGPKRSPRDINTGEKTIERAPDMSTNILEPLYNFSNEHLSSIQMELSKDAFDTTVSDIEINEEPDYLDDFSADVDNYNSPSEFRNQSPISLGKASDDDNFWES